jgi:hypothetical protein
MPLRTEILTYTGCSAKNKYASSTGLDVDMSKGCEVVLHKTSQKGYSRFLPNHFQFIIQSVI